MQKHVNLVDLVKSFQTNIFLQNLASIQKRTSPLEFAHLAEKSGKSSISNLSTKVRTATNHPLRSIIKTHVLPSLGEEKRTLIYLHGCHGFAAIYAGKRDGFFTSLRQKGTKIVLAQAPFREGALGPGDKVVRSSWFR